MRVAINGFGRIGRMIARLIQDQPGIELVAINDRADVATMAHLLKYDSVHGKFPNPILVGANELCINGKSVAWFQENKPKNIPWPNVDIVFEATGVFKGKETFDHLGTGRAQKVIITAPTNDADIKTVVMGVNEEILSKEDVVVSNASCTTNNAAPMIQALDQLCGIEQGYITTVHSYTGDQRLHDAPHQDLRRARAATQSIVPTTTGAAKAITKIFPHLEGKLGGCGIRVPVPDGSLTDITCTVRNPVSMEEINAFFKETAEGKWKGILGYTEDPIVSVDIIGNPLSCLVDGQLTSVLGSMVKVVGWYDNEAGYSNRLLDLAKRFCQ
ncbi:MAG: glyceraldehyde 3-phosphate dehydrogenase [Luteibaculaceae bacterium]|jgi:glyceraldehyde 3-phosphate dehydrogenase